MAQKQNTKRLKIIKQDPWLEPVEYELNDRLARYTNRLEEIEKHFGSLSKFADAYKFYGFNYDSKLNGWYYREWATEAKGLYLIGDFNQWDRASHPLVRKDFGVWEIFLPDSKLKLNHQSLIKVLVHSNKGWQERIPAYINRVIQDDETKNFTAQIWNPAEKFDWQGDSFDVGTLGHHFIYECHIGMATEEEKTGTYLEFAEKVLPRIQKSGYNVIQLMAVAEHPYYGSFGYHVANFFAPSSRFGTPEDLKYLIREAHKMGIAVIMDIVHSHTVKNTNEGINQFDGTEHQYFHTGERGNHPAWDSKLFDYGKIEVLRFLLSNTKYWLKEFHFDGYRFDGVTSMMFHHHGFTDFDSREKYFKEGVEFDAITYLQLANKLIHTVNKNALSIAEDVSGMPGLCHPIADGGIGFDYRLGMGIPDFWIKLLKEKKDEDWNIYELWHTLNNRTPDVKTIAYAESHDQALVGDKTLAFWLMDKEMYFCMDKSTQNPIIDRGLALHKMIRLFTIALGGNAYLNFMGNEFGHPEWIDFPRVGNHWSYKHARRQWSLADKDYLKYHWLADFDREMIRVIKENKMFDNQYAGELNMDDSNKTVVFERNQLIFVFNFHIFNSIPDYHFYVPWPGKYRIILNSDNKAFGGFGRIDESLDYYTFDKNGAPHLSVYNTNRTALVLKRIE